MSRYELSGKVVLVTGAARGIGLETARAAAGRGARVAIVDLEEEAALAAARTLGPSAIGLAADVTDAAALEAAVSATVGRFGRIDVAIANAGITPPHTTVRAMPAEAFERVIEVDLIGVWRTVVATIGQIVANRGQLILVSSAYAFLNGVLNSAYATAKAGVEALGRSLRAELRPHGASATIACFGFVRTEMVREAFADPVLAELRRTLPRFITREVPPDRIGRAVVGGIERRAPTVIEPFEWKVGFALRGLLGPLMDRRLERDPRVAGIVRRAEGDSRGGPDLLRPEIGRRAGNRTAR